MNYYEILGVTEDATLKEIKQKYKELSLRYHPDKNPDDQYSIERFKKISEAYTTLSDYNQRIRYDNSKRLMIPITDMGTNIDRLLNIDSIFNTGNLLTNNENVSSSSVSVSTLIENGVKKTKKITNNNGVINIEENEGQYDNSDLNKMPLIQRPFSFF
tara:strand:+ start:79 stop:552 length:474 start_codon:yes stop_codon:yes gene_type:complete